MQKGRESLGRIGPRKYGCKRGARESSIFDAAFFVREFVFLIPTTMERIQANGYCPGGARPILVPPWPPVASRGLPWPPVASRGLPWLPVASHGLPWTQEPGPRNQDSEYTMCDMRYIICETRYMICVALYAYTPSLFGVISETLREMSDDGDSQRDER